MFECIVYAMYYITINKNNGFCVPANCGGLLGLFSGFSVLSLIEIIYYITLRFYTNMKSQRKKCVIEDEAADHLCHQDAFKVNPNEKKDITV